MIAFLAFLAVLFTAGPSHGLTVAGQVYDDNAFADALGSYYGDFMTSGGDLAQVLTDKDQATWAASYTSGAYVQLGFVDNAIVNGPGADLALYELGRPDTFRVSLTPGGTSLQYLSQYTGTYVGAYPLTVALVNLDDFGVSVGAKVSQIYVGLDVPTGTSVPTLSLAGAINSSAPETANQPPVANAGAGQTVHVGRLVTLDGSSSSDPDGNVPISYSWEIVAKPAGSQVTLSDSSLVNPTFTPDANGDYQVQLIVTDSLGLAGTPATVTVSTTNSTPVAAAGPDQFITAIGTLVTLDGSHSYDDDGDSLTYEWTLVSKPTGSQAVLELADPQKPAFVADVHGEFQVQLLVKDSWSTSQPSLVTVSFLNVKPVASPGTSQSAVVGTLVSLDGSGSSDANGDPLTYKWNFVSLPAGSSLLLADPTAVTQSFVPDLPGTYVIQLIVNDGFVDSDPGTIQIEVVTLATRTIRDIQNFLQVPIIAMDAKVFQNANLQNTLLNKLNKVIANINSGNYQDALEQLQNDILGKADGCAKSGAPDKNDWILDPTAQNTIYPYLLEIISELEKLAG